MPIQGDPQRQLQRLGPLGLARCHGTAPRGAEPSTARKPSHQQPSGPASWHGRASRLCAEPVADASSHGALVHERAAHDVLQGKALRLEQGDLVTIGPRGCPARQHIPE